MATDIVGEARSRLDAALRKLSDTTRRSTTTDSAKHAEWQARIAAAYDDLTSVVEIVAIERTAQ